MRHDLIPPGVRMRLKSLRLASRRAEGGHGIGAHVSRSRGSGIEFAQYRAYEPGDELKQIDWKLYGRSDKFFVRESERESPVTAWIVVDGSASMAQADRARPDWSRLDATKAIAASIAELALMQGDRFAAALLSGNGPQVVPPGHGARQRDRLLIALHGLSAQGQVPSERALAPIWERIGARDLVIFIGDWFDEAAVSLIERLAKAGREVLAIQLLTAEERDFPFHGGFLFRDPETGDELLGDGAALKAEFHTRFDAAQAIIRGRLDDAGIRHTTTHLDEAVDAPLRRLFGRAAA